MCEEKCGQFLSGTRCNQQLDLVYGWSYVSTAHRRRQLLWTLYYCEVDDDENDNSHDDGSNDISKDASSEFCFSSHCHGNHFSVISVNILMKFAGHLKVERSCAEAVLRMPLK